MVDNLKETHFSSASQIDSETFGLSQFDISMIGMDSRVMMLFTLILSPRGWIYCLGKVLGPISERPFTPLPLVTTKSVISEDSLIDVATVGAIRIKESLVFGKWLEIRRYRRFLVVQFA